MGRGVDFWPEGRDTGNMKLAKKLAGFSLIELMVVISIIAILMALGAVSFTTAQKKARDATRRGDMRAMQNGFEQYFTENGEYDSTGGCVNMATDDFLPGGLPTDPRPAQSYSCGVRGGYAATDSYCACAQLENEVGNSDDASCDFDNSGNEEFFCVVNQQ